MNSIPITAAALGMVMLSTPSAVAQLFQQGPLARTSGFQAGAGGTIALWEGADDFRLAESGIIGSVQWWGSANFGRDFVVRIYGDAEGKPGQRLFEMDAGEASPVVTPLVIFNNGDELAYSYSAALTTPFVAAANERYWISIASTDARWAWSFATLDPTPGSMRRREIGGEWTENLRYGNDLTFALHAVPEPASACLLGAGAAVLLMRRRRIPAQ